jgi:hypothetical protein
LPDQEHALRDARAEPAILVLVLQNRHQFLQFRLRLVDPGDVVERYPPFPARPGRGPWICRR